VRKRTLLFSVLVVILMGIFAQCQLRPLAPVAGTVLSFPAPPPGVIHEPILHVKAVQVQQKARVEAIAGRRIFYLFEVDRPAWHLIPLPGDLVGHWQQGETPAVELRSWPPGSVTWGLMEGPEQERPWITFDIGD